MRHKRDVAHAPRPVCRGDPLHGLVAARDECLHRLPRRLREQPLGLRRVEHAKARVEAGRDRVRGEEAPAEAVDGGDPVRLSVIARQARARRGAGELAADPLPELRGGALGECEGEDLVDLRAVFQQRPQ